jgi:hypothetical protein
MKGGAMLEPRFGNECCDGDGGCCPDDDCC